MILTTLITGGTGFIGWNIAKTLKEKGKEVILFDIFPPRKYQDLSELTPEVKFKKGDLSSWPEVMEVVKNYNINEIFHTGAMVSEACENNPLAAYMVNINGTFNVLEAANIFNVDKLTFISSIATCNLGQTETITNLSPQRPLSMYGVSKVCGELLGEYFGRKYGLDFRGVRFPSIIGPGRGLGGLSSYTTLMIQEPALNRSYEVFVSEDTVCPFLYYKDAIRCLIELHDAPSDLLKSRMYWIAGELLTATEISDIVKKTIPNAKIFFKPDPEKTKIVKSWAQKIDETGANKDWNWKRKFTPEQAITDFIQEIKSNPEIYN